MMLEIDVGWNDFKTKSVWAVTALHKINVNPIENDSIKPRPDSEPREESMKIWIYVNIWPTARLPLP